MSGQFITDSEAFFTFRRVSDNHQIARQIPLPLKGEPVAFTMPVSTGELVICELDPQRFRFAHLPPFFRSPGPPITKSSQLLREPEAWTPQFTRWADLPSHLADLKLVLGRSPGITLFGDGGVIGDLLVDGVYDTMTGAPVVLAKTALLNTYFRLNSALEPLSGDRTWFSFVQRLVAIGRERLLAFVEPEMERRVRQIHANIDLFRGDYERTPAENHRGNVPAAFQPRIASMVSIKSAHSKGNVQLTLTHLSNPDEVLLDADVDENGALLAHFFDLFKHKVSGGTHPHDIHELLVLQEGQHAGFDLGYRLV